RSEKPNHLALENLKAYSAYYLSATIALANFIGGQRVHLSCHLRPRDRRGRFPSIHEHPIIVSVESQRIAGGFALFGIKNARRSARLSPQWSARQHEPVVCRRVYQSLPGRMPRRLRYHHTVFRDDSVDLPWPCWVRRYSCFRLTPRQQKYRHLLSRHDRVLLLRGHSTVQKNSSLRVGVVQACRCNVDRRDLPRLIYLHQHGQNRLRWILCGSGALPRSDGAKPRPHIDLPVSKPMSKNRPTVVIKLQHRSLHYICVLPQAGIARVYRNRRRTIGGHGVAGYVNGVGGSQHGAVRLRLQIGVRALDVAFGKGVAGC